MRPADPSRAGALWVAGTGAFLLVAAAAVFVAVRWDDIPDGAKLGAVALLTGVALTAGRVLRSRLPATSGVLFHLGAFLLPIDVAAVVVDQGVGWPGVVFAEGIAGLIAFALLARLEPTVPLRWAVGGSGVVFALGLAALSTGADASVPVSPGLVLAGLAVAAWVFGRDRLAVVWAAAAGASPLLGLGELLLPDADVWAQLGVQPPAHAWAPLAAGAVAATVLALEADRRRDLGLAALALTAALLGGATSWGHADTSGPTSSLLAAALFLGVEAVALLVRRDDLWRRPTEVLATAAEVLAVPAALAAAAVVVLTPTQEISGTPAESAACVLLALGWLVADLRRRSDDDRSVTWALVTGGGWAPATAAAAAGAVAAAALAGGPVAAAATMIVLAGVLVVTGRPGASTAALVLAGWAPLAVVLHEPGLAVPLGVAGALLAATGARLHSACADRRPAEADAAWRFGIGALAPAAAAAWAVGRELDPAAGVLVAAVLLWAVGAVAGSAPSRWTDGLGHPARIAAVATLAGWATLGELDTALLAAGLSAVAVIDAARTRDVRIAYALAVTIPSLVAATAGAIGLSVAQGGIALVLAGTATIGVATLVPTAWFRPLAAAGGSALLSGIVVATAEPVALGTALMITGGLLLGAATVRASAEVAAVGGTLLVIGSWLVLGAHQVTATDAYAAPVAAALVAVGWTVRRSDGGASSWVAYGPAIAVVGTTTLLERLDGGSGWHALSAGAVGVAAVGVGGARRLGAPLLLGTALVVVTAVVESLAYTRGVPTWTWLAIGGVVLLAAGIAMERHEVGPIETGRRLADVIQSRYR